MSESLEALLRQHGVVPVVEIEDAATAVGLARALVEAGLPIVEVTYRTDGAEESIRRMRAEVPELVVGAGTVLDRTTAVSAAAAGAHFLVSPGYNPAVVAEARDAGVGIVPGAVTPTEIERAREAGFTLLKFFPAVASGGIPMVSALAGPYREVSFMPTGGIRSDTLADWLAVPAIAACGGTWIAPRELIAAGRFDEIGERAREAAAITAAAIPALVAPGSSHSPRSVGTADRPQR
ncbi:bifunctional 4-hydroxy-2-oxoglutarate aldolase/2-dehydro-3-deoxy-phosphogluconate aldolase [Herbiconiux sp. P16]|uniref:bifunctional 4-hydroxy-2-oxoglutarate aldolase/2-dehydro-3-deoxy-phosphogluconate aldolase n=1 Tax=Herbiconiux wuyangfengii TaxID=3342794 RepID=UPI0035B7D440